MEFNSNTPIYLQIAESICQNILSGKWTADERIPSVREMSAALQVNPNTTMRSYDMLQQKEIIYNRRGIGYFVAAEGREKIILTQKETFINEELPRFTAKAKLLNISAEETIQYIKESFNK